MGLAFGVFRHEDGFGVIADLELSLMGALMGGLAFFLATRAQGNGPMDLMVSVLAAVVFLALLKPLYRGNRKAGDRS